MGIDFSHGDARFGYGGVNYFRQNLAKAIGIDLLAMQGHGGSQSWEGISDPLVLFLQPFDVEIKIPPDLCPAVADRLLEVTTTFTPPDGWKNADAVALEVIEGLREAATRGELFKSF